MRENIKIIVWWTRSSTCAAAGGRRRARVDRGDAEGQADPHDRGRDQPVERVRTASRAFERLVDHLEQRREEGCDGFAVQHVQATPEAERTAERGRDDLRARPGLISEIGPVIGTHTGPGILGVTGLRTELLGPTARGFRDGRLEPRGGGRPARSPQPRSASDHPGHPGLRTADHPAHAFIAVLFAISLYLIYLLRRPIGWVLIACSSPSRCRARSTPQPATCDAASRSRSCTSACC